jgi:hypothetical protein
VRGKRRASTGVNGDHRGMSSLGSGAALWRVDVVLRRAGATDAQADEVVSRLATDLSRRPASDDETIFRDVESTNSYDMPPPEGSVGVSLWVRADTVGVAVQVGFNAVQAATQEVTGHALPLWDLRVVPRSAMMTRDEFESVSAPPSVRD